MVEYGRDCTRSVNLTLIKRVPSVTFEPGHILHLIGEIAVTPQLASFARMLSSDM